MIDAAMRRALMLSTVGLGLIALAGCASQPQPEPPAAAPPPAAALPLPPKFQPSELVGRWGYASYHRPEDRARTEGAARAQCGKPYVINRGPTGGIMMHLADEAQPSEVQVKGGPGGKTYIGPGPEAGGDQDREVVSFDGRVLILHWLDPEVQGRYGDGVYVRCAPRA
jgi:hypothetical protein